MLTLNSFLKQYESLVEQVNVLIREADTIQWDPTVGAQYAGTGQTHSPSTPKQPPAPTQAAGKAKRGDVVFVQNPNGQYQPSIVAQADERNVMLMNASKQATGVRPIGSLRPAPANLMAKYPGRTGWMLAQSTGDTFMGMA